MSLKISINRSFKPLSGNKSEMLNHNPDRGFRTELCLLIKEHYPDEIYFNDGVRFETKEEAEKHKVGLGPGYTYSAVNAEDGSVLYYVVKFTERARSVFCDKDDDYNNSVLEGLFRSYFKLNNENEYRYDPSYLVLSYLYLTDFHDRAITESALNCMALYFKFCRKRKIKNMLRVSYNWEYLLTHTEGEHNKWLLSSECADADTIDLHTKQLSPLIGEYKDTVHSISNGFVGFVGEWAWHYQWPEVDYNKATLSIVENLCKPNGLYFSARLPKYRYDFQQAYPDYEYHHLVGLNNDAFYGEQEYESPYTYPDGKKTVTRWNSSNYGKNLVDEEYGICWWDHTIETAYKTPQDGEMYVQQALTSWNMRPYGYDAMLECAHHRHTSLSYWHGYLDTNENPQYFDTNIMTAWQNPEDKFGYYAPLSVEKLKELGIIYDPAWFLDDNGNVLSDRNAYNYIRDHLGYRIRLTELIAESDDSNENELKISLKLKNYGFAAAFNLSSRIVILNSEYKEVSRASAGEPAQWISLPADIYNGKNCEVEGDIQDYVISHSIDCKVALPDVQGKYYLAFALDNSVNNSAKIANELEFINGYNIMASFEI